MIPAAFLQGIIVKAAARVDWRKMGGGACVPMDLLRAEGERRWPGRWPGGWQNFGMGARGLRFWVPEADNDNGAEVKETGMICYTQGGEFVSWSQIFGADWVRRAVDTGIGAAVEGIWYDAGGRRFWRETPQAGWVAYNKEDMRAYLNQRRGMSLRPAQGQEASQADQALLHIQDMQIVHGAAPLWFRPHGVQEVNDKTLLNISRVKLMQPVPDKNPQGEGFPLLRGVLEGMLRDQMVYYAHWLAHFYLSCLNNDPERGLALFLAGPAAAGKTFLNVAVHRMIFGKAEDATNFMMKVDQFNAELVGSPIWMLNDPVAPGDAGAKERFMGMLKFCSANEKITFRAMRADPITMPWSGRICAGINDDPESLSLLPSAEANLLDKVSFLRVHAHDAPFPSDDELRRELPWFCAWLRDMPKDPAIWIGSRYTIKPLHDLLLMEESQDQLRSTSSADMIHTWAKEHFQDSEAKKRGYWEGNSTELIMELSRLDSLRPQVNRLLPTATWMGRSLNQLILREVPWLEKRPLRNYRIDWPKLHDAYSPKGAA